MRGKVIKTIIFFSFLILGFAITVQVLRFKNVDGVYMMESFYKQEDNTVDVLVLGTSHAFEHFNPGVLWEEHGMASYVLGGPNQRLWNTYYFLKEALKTQRPQLIILEGFAVSCTDDYLTDGQIVSNTYGMKWSSDKLTALKDTVSDERLKDFLPEYIRYHSRYKDISEEDFLKDQGDPYYENWKGFFCNFQKGSYEAEDMSGVTGTRPLDPKAQLYYEKILQLAKDEGIPLLVVISPYPNVNEDHMMAFNTAELLAEQYGADFLNCNRDVSHYGIDFKTDGADAEHLNYHGNQKFSHVFGNDISELYELTDRRGDPGYESWQQNADYLREMIVDQELRECGEKNDLLKRLENPNYWIFATVNGSSMAENAELYDYLDALGIPREGAKGIWFRDNTREGAVLTGTGEYERYYRHGKNDFCVECSFDKDQVYRENVIVNHEEYPGISNGLSLVIYDTMTEQVVDSLDINAANGSRIIRRE